jgi:hypothetical protein
MNQSEISVVIPTLGGAQLAKTIDFINAGTLVPKIIYLCIPEGFELKTSLAHHDNVTMVWTKVRGQVGQRAVGLGMAETSLILQLDDDILLDPGCLAGLVDAWEKLGPDCAVAPSFIKVGTQESLYRIETRTWTKKCYFWLLNGRKGYQPGSITQAGTAFGADLLGGEVSEFESEWLPGGCVLHHRQNLITENYFPFAGKAYSEDLFFSRLARARGLKLYIIRDSRCQVDPMPELARLPLRDIFRQFSGDIRVRKHYVRETGRSLIRMYLYYFVQLLSSIAGKARPS